MISLSATHERFPLSRPFRIARGVKDAADVVTVRIADGSVTGWGECVPYARYGETVEDTLAAITAMAEAVADGLNRAALMSAMPAGAARNAVDCALWDVESKRLGSPVSHRTGAALVDGMITAVTIGIDTPKAMAAAARAVAPAPLLKVKVNAASPEDMIAAVRDAVPDAQLIIDANESWTIRDVERMQPALARAKVVMLEQPIAAGKDGDLAGFAPDVPICADESLHEADDLAQVAARYQIINIKLDKTGGLTAALQLVNEARALGLGVMTGCMVSSSLSIAPALHIAAMSDFVDLDGPWWLAADRPGGLRIVGGRIILPDPGFWGGS